MNYQTWREWMHTLDELYPATYTLAQKIRAGYFDGILSKKEYQWMLDVIHIR